MTTDRELLEAAAKAAGIKLGRWCAVYADDRRNFFLLADREGSFWNPLIDDGDALRLAVVLGLAVDCGTDPIAVGNDSIGVREAHRGDPLAATRRAIVRAAAAMAEVTK
jgi:hypothetical protein